MRRCGQNAEPGLPSDVRSGNCFVEAVDLLQRQKRSLRVGQRHSAAQYLTAVFRSSARPGQLTCTENRLRGCRSVWCQVMADSEMFLLAPAYGSAVTVKITAKLRDALHRAGGNANGRLVQRLDALLEANVSSVPGRWAETPYFQAPMADGSYAQLVSAGQIDVEVICPQLADHPFDTVYLAAWDIDLDVAPASLHADVVNLRGETVDLQALAQEIAVERGATV
jgi:hypothetical protein